MWIKNKSQLFIEKITGKPLPYFETTISLYTKDSQTLIARWSIGENYKIYLSKEYGEDFWEKGQPTLRINYSSQFFQPYHEDTNIDLAQGVEEVKVNAPGATINTQVGIIMENGTFIPFACSNDITIPNVH